MSSVKLAIDYFFKGNLCKIFLVHRKTCRNNFVVVEEPTLEVLGADSLRKPTVATAACYGES